MYVLKFPHTFKKAHRPQLVESARASSKGRERYAQKDKTKQRDRAEEVKEEEGVTLVSLSLFYHYKTLSSRTNMAVSRMAEDDKNKIESEVERRNDANEEKEQRRTMDPSSPSGRGGGEEEEEEEEDNTNAYHWQDVPLIPQLVGTVQPCSWYSEKDGCVYSWGGQSGEAKEAAREEMKVLDLVGAFCFL